ncbi:uncharacterized protein HMPREF1541_03732 [Cyphellophora europaea CBS 101466]|uniref:J domain-containing protein n=1 Tax=Cyphellophora europaea (strain CBS 101466) TaxID=1220924 RepID=W2RZM1_CYPE1|nr:uncharacterized protein HMPREF1541_03732 [Cyphellophora europaea CBS 101466]ETN41795.1 hypothetical protein HMPREF1541_03732 [Cyphellophora europaea CBS 101466]
MVVIEFPLLHGSFPNYYDLLGITIAASARDIQIAFRKTALREHPDKAGSSSAQNEKFAAINNRKDVLLDAGKRTRYDRALRQQQPRPAPSQGYSKPPHASNSRCPQPQHASRPGPRAASSPFPSSGPSFSQTSYGTRFASNPDFTPFGSGAGFGPERNATNASQTRNATPPKQSTSNPHPREDKTYERGCPCCGSQSCPGSRYSGQQNNPDKPCSYRNQGFYFHFGISSMPKPFSGQQEYRFSDGSTPASFHSGSGSQRTSTSNPANNPSACTGNPNRCPKHNASGVAEESHRKQPEIRGDPHYVNPKQHIPFQQFYPPASAYNFFGHNGIKPTTRAWYQSSWKCLSLSGEHDKAVDTSLKLHHTAPDIEKALKT